MRAEDLIKEIEDKYPNDIRMIEELDDKERIEYIATIKLVAWMKQIVKG